MFSSSPYPEIWVNLVDLHGQRGHTTSFQQIKSLKHQMATLKLCQTEGQNVEVFTTKILQILNLGENVCSDAHFTLNEQLSTSSVEQFQVKFMA